jgi:O-antigen ligase
MRWSARLEQAQHVACCLLAATIPLLFIWSTLSIWAIIICWALSGKYRSTWRHFREQPAYWLWVIYFGLHAASYFWSSDKDQSLFDTVSKLSFVILPVVVGAGANICRRRLERILGSFILGISCVALFCFAQAIMLWHDDGDNAHFFYHDLVSGFDANAVYMAWYVFAALSALLLVEWQYLFQAKWRLLNGALAAILLVFFVLLSSRLLLAIFVTLTIPVFLVKKIRSPKGSLKNTLGVAALVLSIAGTLALTQNPISKRFRDVMHSDVSIAFLKDYTDVVPHFNNLTLRLFVWRCGMDNMRNHNLWLKGCGNGDEHHIQNARFYELGITPERQERYAITIHNINLHNMFMQSLVMFGIPGLVVFMLMMITPFFHVIKVADRQWFFVFFMASFLFMIQESALQTQAGVIFFTYFSCIFLQAVKKMVKGEKLTNRKR